MTKIEVTLLIIIFAIIGAIVAFPITELTTHAACLRHGYPNSQVSLTFIRYCIKRVNQTDTVVRLSTLK